MAQSRQTAFKLRICDIKNNKYIKELGEWEPNYILFNGNKISRVNVIANIIVKIESPDKSYMSILLDDGTETIRAKCWREDTKILENLNIGDIVLVIGRIRQYGEEIYLTPEIVKNISHEWVLVRKLELDKLYGKLITNQNNKDTKNKNYELETNLINISEERIENLPNESKRQKIFSLIEKLDTEVGADKIQVIDESGIDKFESERIIDDLLREGEIFQIKPGKLKLID